MLDIKSKTTKIEEALKGKDYGKKFVFRGWIYRKRGSGGKIFFIVRDATSSVQCVVDKSVVNEKEWKEIEDSYLESSIIVGGTLKEDKRAPGNAELSVTELKVVHIGEQFPITEYQSPEFLLDTRHLWVRSKKINMIMRARSKVFRYARAFLDNDDFYEITPPLITTLGGETGANLFEVDYFGKKAFLTESSQLYLESMIASLERVYSFAPSYRAEKSRTIKHLAEYWHLEPEIAYADNDQNMAIQEHLVSHIANKLAKEEEEILKELNVDIDSLKKMKPPFKRISYDDAIEILADKGSDKKWGDDFGVEEEKLLTEDETFPIFVYNWPKEIKAFYMPVNPKDDRVVSCADMLAPHGHGEIIGGSERIWDLDELIGRMKEKELKIENYKWYVELRKYGSVPHAGFGVGIERVIKWMLNLDHIRDAIPFPRVINRVTP